MSEQQLERSVLESKEREELFAIAEALGTHPTTRARKGDLVTAILRATGVEAGEEDPAPPRRTRARKASAATVEAIPEDAAAPPTPAPASSSVDEATGAPSGDIPPGGITSGASAVDSAPRLPLGDVGDRVPPTRPRVSRRVLGTSAADANGVGPPAAGSTGGPPRPENAPGSGDSAAAETAARLPPAPPDSTPSETAPHPGTAPDLGSGPGSNSGKVALARDGIGADGDGTDSRREGESGNRRSRRRRGRDRGERVDRELPPPGAEASFTGEPITVAGHLDLRDEGYGFLRTEGFASSPSDVYVSISQVRRFSLRRGDLVEGGARPATATEKYPALLRIDRVSGATPDEARGRPRFHELVPVRPASRLRLEQPAPAGSLTGRVVDLFTPLGKGQRVLLSGPPRSGQTTVLTSIAQALVTAHPESEVVVLAVDERPEEVTELRRALGDRVVATTFDQPAEEHVQVAELVVARAQRQVEIGREVVLLIDGLTRLARAYNHLAPGNPRAPSAGVDPSALHQAKEILAAARNIEDGASLTMLATVHAGTASSIDEAIYEEVIPTVNAEIRLDARLAADRVSPPIDLASSWTAHEDQLLDADTMAVASALRRGLSASGDAGVAGERTAELLARLAASASNEEFVAGAR